MPFFIRKAAKRKNQDDGKRSKKTKKKEPPPKKDEEVVESESDDDISIEPDVSSEDEDKYLTAQEKKVKIAQKYLADVQKEEIEKLENFDDVSDHVLKKLKHDELEKAGKLKKKLADHIKLSKDKKLLTCKQHKLSITCIAVSSDNKYLYSSSKDYSIVKWSLESFTKLIFKCLKFKKNSTDPRQDYHNCLINCLAISRDDKHLVSGDEKGNIRIWDTETLNHIRVFKDHKKAVTGLAICRDTNYLFSTSKDLLVKCWNLNEMGYMETLFGHQAEVTSVDIINENRVLTAGGTDKTIRLWKIQEESHLIFNAPTCCVEIVRKLDDGFFVSGGDDGSLCLWGTLKKKPLHVINAAHGLDPINKQPNWITAIAVLPNSDLIASGSCDNNIRLWKWNQTVKSIIPLNNIEIPGFVNAIQFTSDGHYLIAGIGKEHRLGRWQNIQQAKNSIICIQIMKINGLN
ncbi:U3 small nucleolar RNA-interacting protein 2 [Planococcus citri]|uniref:U3 small nucleolar RNA-interacting protein 2 n=1 Tax=Planococcus citri TaxID=170843 RepID=UPI0031F9A493